MVKYDTVIIIPLRCCPLEKDILKSLNAILCNTRVCLLLKLKYIFKKIKSLKGKNTII